MASNVTIAYLADITDLRTKSALAKAAAAEFTDEIKKQIEITRSLSEEERGPSLAALQSLIAQRRQYLDVVRQSEQALKQNEGAHKNLLGVLGQNRSAFMELEHVARSFADGIASGASPIRLLGQESGRLVQVVTELNGVSLSQVAKFGAIGAAAIAAAGALDIYWQHLMRLRDERDLAVSQAALGTPIDADEIHQLSASLREAGLSVQEFSDLTAQQRLKVVRDFQSIRVSSVEMTRALVDIAPDFAHVFGTTSEQAVTTLRDALNDLGGKGAEVMAQLHLTTGELADFQRQASEDPKRATITFLETLQNRLKTASESMDSARQSYVSLWRELEHPEEIISFFSKRVPILPPAVSMTLGDMTGDVATQRQAATHQQNQQTNVDIQAAGAKIPNNLAPDTTAIADTMQRMAMDISKTHDQIATEQADYLKTILDQDRMSAQERASLSRQYAQAEHTAAITASDETVRDLQVKARQAAAAAGAQRKDEVEAELATLREGLNNTKLTADAKKEIEEQIASLEIRDVRATASAAKQSTQEKWEAYKAGLDAQIAAARGNYAEQIRLLQQEVSEATRLYGEQSRQAQEAIKAEANARYEAGQAAIKSMTEQLDAQRNLAKAGADLSSTGARSNVGEFKPDIGLALDSSGLQAKVATQVDQLRSALNTDLAALNNEMAAKINLANTLAPGSDPYKELVKSASANAATAASMVKSSADQIASINEHAAQAVQASWQKITGPIENALGSTVDAVLRGGRNERAEIERAAAGILASYTKMAAQRLLVWGEGELGMTAATATGTAARDAIANQGQAKQLQDIVAALQKMVAVETAKTGAVATGEATRVGIQAAGAATGAAVQKTAAVQSVTVDAGKAAAGAYAAVSDIPIIGPILAPAAAAVAYGAVAAFGSFDVGTMNVDRDQIAQIHQGEIIIPAAQSAAIRSAMGSAGTASGAFPSGLGEQLASGLRAPSPASAALGGTSTISTANGGDVHIHYSPTIHAAAGDVGQVRGMLKSHSQEIHSMMQENYGNGFGVGLPGRQNRR